MSEDDDEVLPLGNDLSRHMISEGYTQFETYIQHRPMSSRNSHQAKYESSCIYTNNSDGKTYLPHCDHTKLHNLLTSKLLLPADFEIVEFLTSKTSIQSSQTSYFWVYSGSVIVSSASMALYFSKRVGFLLPVTLVSTLSILGLGHLCYHLHRITENRSFDSTIRCLQSLCVTVNKLFRLLKETEILSTGQINTHNVGAALYIPVKSLVDQGTLPPWKTLPHIRKLLANALLDTVDVLKLSCAEARRIAPEWVNIEGYTLSNECSLPETLSRDCLSKTDSYISLKDLQILNDTYLILQSELLRWIGFCICPSAWSFSDSKYKTSRSDILKLFCNVHSQLSSISFKLRNHYDIQNIFIENEVGIMKKLSLISSDMTEIKSIQTELHKLYLLILSMLVHLKSLEDQLEMDSNGIANTELNSLKDKLNEQLKSVKGKLTSAVKMYDSICLNSFSNPNSCNVQSETFDQEDINNTTSTIHKNPPDNAISQSECQSNSLDEVFLAITDYDQDKQEKRDDWDLDSNPSFPKTLLAELSTTLKPIKETFKEREKAALERAGLEDINIDSDNDKDLESLHLTSKPHSKVRKRKMSFKGKRTRYELLTSDSEDLESDSSNQFPDDNSVNDHKKIKPLMYKDDSSTNCSLPSDKSIASMIAIKSQSWGLAEEEYYSDD